MAKHFVLNETKAVCWQNIKRNQGSMLKFMFYHTNIICLWAH